jgi:ribonuclease HI
MRQLQAHPRGHLASVRAFLNTDGGARGNPGPAGIGVVLRTEAGEVMGEIARGIGESTNNVAEYTALIEGLRYALDKGVTDITVRVDSELVVAQVKGAWKIKNDRLRPLAAQARGLLDRFHSFDIAHVRREQNADADKLANQGIDVASVNAELGDEWQPGDAGRAQRGHARDTFLH